LKKKAAKEPVQIVVVSDPVKTTTAPADRRKIRALVKDKLLSTSSEPYHKVQVEVKRAPNGKPKALIVSMLRARSYTADVFKVSVDPDYNARSIEPSTAA